MMQPWQRDQEIAHLHPIFRAKVNALLKALDAEGLPFRLFEGFRSPHRQQYLYDQGRKRPGNIVTKAKPWTSYHQYGLASDFVLYENNKWSWDTSGQKRRWWDRLQELGREQGLQPISWEKPHLQLRDLNMSNLQAGNYPPDGDSDWAEWMEAAIYSWTGSPESPPLPEILPERPALEEVPLLTEGIDETPVTSPSPWHSFFEGCEWRYDDRGVYRRDKAGGKTPFRTPGKPITCRTIWSLFSDEIVAASQKYDVPPALIMMVIATETGFAKRYGFTGSHTFRWEPHVEVKDVSPPIWGDYSAGPMQTLATTARWVIRSRELDYDPFTVAPVFEFRPEPPDVLPLYDPAINIDIGTSEIKHRFTKTGDDPILVSAAFNAGGLYKSSKNDWHLRSHGNHLDRAAAWYGDACTVIAELQA